MRAILSLAAAGLLLAACSSSDDGNNSAAAASDAGGNGATGNALPEASPQNSAGSAGALFMNNEQNAVVPIDLPSPKPLAHIPDGYAGRWGMVPEDCTSQDAAKGLMTIAGDTLRFYEARATAGRIVDTGGGRIAVHLAFAGEGRTWAADEALTLTSGGKTLVRDEQQPAHAYQYFRCT